MKLAGEAQSMTEASFSYLIDHKLQPTIENCYVALHSGGGGKHIERKASPERLHSLDESTKAEGKDFLEMPTENVAEALERMPEGTQDSSFRSERLESFRIQSRNWWKVLKKSLPMRSSDLQRSWKGL